MAKRTVNYVAGVGRLYSSGPHDTPLGTTKVTGSPATPVRRFVRLHNQETGKLIREQWSNAVTGQYQFRHLAAGRYYVVAFDHTGAYNGEIATDVVLPTP
jgi:nicotinamide riboside kinase